MKIYCDTSVIVGLRVPKDSLHAAAVTWQAKHQMDCPLWNAFLHLEVFNAIRQLARAKLWTEGEARQTLSNIKRDLHAYFDFFEPDWRDVYSQAHRLVAEYGFDLTIGGSDLLHVALALESSAELFVTGDEDQAALAREAGLKTVHLKQPSSK